MAHVRTPRLTQGQCTEGTRELESWSQAAQLCPLPCCVTSGVFLNLSAPPLPHLSRGTKNNDEMTATDTLLAGRKEREPGPGPGEVLSYHQPLVLLCSELPDSWATAPWPGTRAHSCGPKLRAGARTGGAATHASG